MECYLSVKAEGSSSHSDLPVQELARLRGGLHIMALRALGSSEAAEEAVQETLARIVAILREGRSVPENLAAFTCGIARHVIADVHRARGRAAGGAERIENLPHAGPDPLLALVSREEKRRVREALARVPEADREILRLAFYEGLPSRDIAERLGEPGDRVRKRKQRAIERLRRAFLAGGHEALSRTTEGTER